MKEEKLEQLRKAFKAILGAYIGSWNIDRIVNKLVYEVKIRIPDKGGGE